jgi:penicillin-binding protein 1A
MQKLFRLIIIAIILGFLASGSGLIYLYSRYSKDLPNYQQLKLYNPLITSRIYSADGKLIKEYSKENRIFVSIDIIPKHLINAFIAAEDGNFYKHSGVDLGRIFRASVINAIEYLKGNSISGGASTITQQVVKNFLLTNERTIDRKIKEAILAFKITRAFSKDRILELYLNQIYLGSGSYGVAAAAQAYFD